MGLKRQTVFRDRPDAPTKHNAGSLAMIGFLSVYNSAGTEFVVSNAIINSVNVEKRVNHRYAYDSVNNPFLLVSG